ncbi:MAG: hypothetical protein WCV86_00300 [Patescibacteria group bacterium]|jgi:hypothetical protein
MGDFFLSIFLSPLQFYPVALYFAVPAFIALLLLWWMLPKRDDGRLLRVFRFVYAPLLMLIVGFGFAGIIVQSTLTEISVLDDFEFLGVGLFALYGFIFLTYGNGLLSLLLGFLAKPKRWLIGFLSLLFLNFLLVFTVSQLLKLAA